MSTYLTFPTSPYGSLALAEMGLPVHVAFVHKSDGFCGYLWDTDVVWC